jgi:lysophospholipase L1-like esterase
MPREREGSEAAQRPADSTAHSAPNGLGRFEQALAALARGERSEAVRVLWLGDSHTAADFMTGAVRDAAWRRHTPGGPGFLRLGLPHYRHDQATVKRTGRFRVEPAPPSRRDRQGDGVFGLGGMRATPLADGAEITIKPSPGSLRGRALYSVLFDLPRGASFEALLGKQVVRVPRDQAGRQVPDSPILRLDLEGDPSDVLKLRAMRGRPRFFGAFVEGSEPGVVLDTAGIDGARLATVLAWAEKVFVAEVNDRHPELLVVAYGTNEAFDAGKVDVYGSELVEVLGRLRRGAPDADCVVLGPPDALDPAGAPLARVAEIAAVYAGTARALGCMFLSGQALMGGPGSFVEWVHQRPQLARADRIHLTPLGYRVLGSRLGEELLGEGAAGAAARTYSP